MLVNLSPGRLLRDPLEAATRAGTFELRPVDAGDGRQRGHVEDVADAVLRILGGALGVGHGSHLPGQAAALGNTKQTQVSCLVLIMGSSCEQVPTFRHADIPRLARRHEQHGLRNCQAKSLDASSRSVDIPQISAFIVHQGMTGIPERICVSQWQQSLALASQA